MSQNRNKLISLLIGNITNAIVHTILEKATEQEELLNKYNKELLNSFEIAKKYREKINPLNPPFPSKDIEFIKEKIIKRVKAELNLRISKGYKNIDLGLIESALNDFLKRMKIV